MEVGPELRIAQWMLDKQVCQECEELIRRDGIWAPIFQRLLSGEKITRANVVDGFLCLLHKSRWQLVIPDHLNIDSKPAKEFLINQAHVNNGHVGQYKTYVELSNIYHQQDTYAETKAFVESRELCQLTKSRSQKPGGLFTALNVPTKLWIEIVMDFQFLKRLIVDCTKFMPGLRLSDKQEANFFTLCKVLNIVDRHSGYSCIILCTAEIDADGVIDIIERLIKPTVGLPLSIVSDHDPLFMLGKFQELLQVNGVRHKVTSTYHLESDGQTESKNKDISDMFAAAQLERDDWITGAPKIQAKVNARQNTSRGESPFFTGYGFQPNLALPELPHPIPIYSDPAKTFYQAADKITKAKYDQIIEVNKHRREALNYRINDQVILSTKNLPAAFHQSKPASKWIGPFKITNLIPWSQNVTLDPSELADLQYITNFFHT